MSKPLCIYHGGCDDGFAAAWVVRKYFGGEVDIFPGVYQSPPPDVTGRDVLLVDFSYKAPVLDEMAAKANSILVLDHHKTAADDLTLAGAAASGWEAHLDNAMQDRMEGVTRSLYALFDMERCGSRITWDFFFPRVKVPQLLAYIEDRDLWRNVLPMQREIIQALRSYPHDFDVWEKLMDGHPNDGLMREGVSILRYYESICSTQLVPAAIEREIAGVVMPTCNAPYAFASDVAGKLAEDHPSGAALCWFATPSGISFSLRSRGDGPDVSKIALKFGGGGHRGASGFRLPHAEALTLLGLSQVQK